MTDLEWRPVVGWESKYEVSEFGQVRRRLAAQGTRVGYVLKPILSARGYWLYNLRDDQREVKARAHRLVLDAFVGPEPEMFGLHKDDDPANNHVSNLRWGSRLDNADDWKQNGRRRADHNLAKTHCLRGHEFTAENTRVKVDRGSGVQRRICRACCRIRQNGYAQQP